MSILREFNSEQNSGVVVLRWAAGACPLWDFPEDSQISDCEFRQWDLEWEQTERLMEQMEESRHRPRYTRI